MKFDAKLLAKSSHPARLVPLEAISFDPILAGSGGLMASSISNIGIKNEALLVREIPTQSLVDSKDSFKVALAQIASEPGRLDFNAKKIIDCIEEAWKRGVKLIVFPELILPNYNALDLFQDRNFLKACNEWLSYIAKATEKFPGITAAVGTARPDFTHTRPNGSPVVYNSVAILSEGKVLDWCDKTLLPQYAIFDEPRYFTPAKERKVIEIAGRKVGFIICEDLWIDGYDLDPAGELKDLGAELIIHPTASPLHIGKNATRAKLAERITNDFNLPYLGVNLVGTYDGYEGDIPFDGRGLARDITGNWLAMGTPFNQELLILDPFYSQADSALSPSNLAPEQEAVWAAVSSIRSFFDRLELQLGRPSNAVIGLSGGIDSHVIAALTCMAIGPERTILLSLPTKFNSNATKGDARKAAEALGARFEELPIQDFYEAGIATLKKAVTDDSSPDELVKQNLQARLRTAAIMAYANAFHGVMINTSNKTERFTNNFTIYADSSGAFGPIADWDKDILDPAAHYLNKLFNFEVVPESVITRVATAELRENQQDSDVMGLDPRQAAPYIRTLIEEGINDIESAKLRFGNEISHDLLARWIGQIASSEWKGRQLPPGTRISKVSHGFNRRIPINHGWHGQVPPSASFKDPSEESSCFQK